MPKPSTRRGVPRLAHPAVHRPRRPVDRRGLHQGGCRGGRGPGLPGPARRLRRLVDDGSGGTAARSAKPTGTVTRRLQRLGRRPEEGLRRRCSTAFTAKSGVKTNVNTVDHNTFQENINNYLQGSPDDVFTWFAGYRMRFFAAQGLAGDISDVWDEDRRRLQRRLQEGVDRRRRQAVLRADLQLPVGR